MINLENYKVKTIGSQTLIQGDCLEVMKYIPDKSIDMILADLPFGTTNCSWDTVIDLKLLWEQYERIIKDNGAILLFAQTPFDKILGCSNLKLLRYEWIWEKTQATGHLNSKKMPMKAHENILVFYKKLPIYNPQKTFGHTPTNSYTKSVKNGTADGEIYGTTKAVSGGGSTDRYPRSIQTFSSDKQKVKLHPTQKPVALLEYLIKTYTHEGMTVLDNCAGSFSTLKACQNTNRIGIGIELDENYFNIGIERLSKND